MRYYTFGPISATFGVWLVMVGSAGTVLVAAVAWLAEK